MSNQKTSPQTLRETIATDLYISAKRVGFRATVATALFDPGFFTVLVYRVAHRLDKKGWPRLAKLIWRFNVFQSGCYMHLYANVGHSLLLPHPVAVLFGEGAIIGDRVTLYQNVSLGRGMSDGRYPTIEDDAVICPNTVIIGGVIVGKHALVGAGSIVTKDVPPYAIVAGNPARVLRIRAAPEET